MRIVVNDIAATKGGGLSVLSSLYEYVVKNDRKNEWFFWVKEGCFSAEDTENVKVVSVKNARGRFARLWFDFILGARYAKKLKADYILSLQNTCLLGTSIRQGVYIHQSIPFQTTKQFSFFKREEVSLAVYQHIIGRIIFASAKKAKDVFVQTEWMKRRLARITDDSKVHVVPLPADDVYALRDKANPDNRRFFYPTLCNESYKNIECIAKACERLTYRGINGYGVYITLDDNSCIKNKNIIYCGKLSKDELIKHYQTSVLVFPSYIETVGLPLKEARMIGTVIIAADCDYAHEVLEGYANAYYFDPFNYEELANIMEKVIKQKISLNEVSIAERSNRSDIGWGDMINIMEEIDR